MRNEKIKRVIAGVAGGVWVHAQDDIPVLWFFYGCDVFDINPDKHEKYHRVISIKACDYGN